MTQWPPTSFHQVLPFNGSAASWHCCIRNQSLNTTLFERHSQAIYKPYHLVCFELPLLLSAAAEYCMILHLLSVEHSAIGSSVSGIGTHSALLNDSTQSVVFCPCYNAAQETGKTWSSISMCTIWETVQWQLFLNVLKITNRTSYYHLCLDKMLQNDTWCSDWFNTE